MIIGYIIAGICILIGLVGSVLPMVPGIPLMLIGIIIAHWASSSTLLSNATLVILSLITLISLGIDYLSGTLGAKFAKASGLAIAFSLIGSIAGIFVLGPIGIILGPALGVLIGELIVGKSIKESSNSAKISFFSTVAGIIVNGLLAIIMLVIFTLGLFN